MDRFDEMRSLSFGQNGYPAQPVVTGLFNCSELVGEARQDETANLTQICITPTTTQKMYYNTVSPIPTLNFAHADFKNNSSMVHMFYGSNFTEIDLSNQKISVPTNMSQMFRDCQNLTKVNLSNFSTEQTNWLDRVFSGCSNLKELNLENFSSLQLKGIYGAFEGCQNLEGELDLSGMDFDSSVTELSLASTFSNCQKITKVTTKERWLENKKITSLANFCKNCYNLESIDLRGLDTSEVTNIEGMFAGCRNLNLINFDDFSVITFYKVRNNLTQTFYDCRKLERVNLNALYTSNTLNMDQMFKDCHNLVEITGVSFSNPSDSTQLRSMKEAFANCYKLERFYQVPFYINRVSDYTRVFSDCRKLKELHFYDNLEIGDTQYGKIYRQMFFNCEELEEISGYEFEGDNPTDTSYMFFNCQKLRSAPVQYLKIAYTSNMDYMFYNCKSMTSIPVGALAPARTSTRYGGSMNSMFENYESLQEIDLRHFRFYCTDADSVLESTSIDRMFAGCKNLKKIDLRQCSITSGATPVDFLKDVPTDCELLIDNWSTNYWMQQNYPEYTNITYSGS